MIDEASIAARFAAFDPQLDERDRCLFAAGELGAGRGSVAAVSRITGLARSTIGRGLKDLDGEPLPAGRVRRAGSGRRNAGTDYRPRRQPHRVGVHDFPDKAPGKVVPYGIYDVAENAEWISLGVDHDTAELLTLSERDATADHR